MNKFNRKFRVASLVLGAALLCGCATARTDTTDTMANTPSTTAAEPSVRLPYGKEPLTVQQAAPPPLGSEQAIVPIEVQEGLARSLQLFQFDFGLKKTGPESAEEAPGPSEAEPTR